MESLLNSNIETKVIIFLILIVLISLVVLFIKNIKIKNKFVNQGIIYGDVDNSVTVVNKTTINTYVSTGQSNNKQPKGNIATLANGILNVPENFMNWVSKDLLSGNDFSSIIVGLILFLIIMLFIFSLGFISIQLIALIALLISSISIIYYSFLSITKKEFINWNLIFIQIIYIFKMLIILLPFTHYSVIIAKNSLSKEGFIFWKNQLSTMFTNIQENSLEVTNLSLVLFAFICLIISYFQLYSSLNLTAQKKTITWKSSISSLTGLLFFILVVDKIEDIANWIIILFQ